MQPRVASSRAPEMVSTATNQAGGCHTASVCVTTSGSFCSVCGGSGVRGHGRFNGPWSTTQSVGSAHRELGGGAGWHWGAPGGDVHHQCHHAAAAAGTRAAPHLHQQDKGAGLSLVIGEVDKGVPFQPKAPILIAWTRGSAQCHTMAEGWFVPLLGRSSPPTMVYVSTTLSGLL